MTNMTCKLCDILRSKNTMESKNVEQGTQRSDIDFRVGKQLTFFFHPCIPSTVPNMNYSKWLKTVC